MATVKEIAADIKETFGGSFVNMSQAGQYLSMGREKAAAFLSDLPSYSTGKERKFHALDIARHMERLRTYRPHG